MISVKSVWSVLIMLCVSNIATAAPPKLSVDEDGSQVRVTVGDRLALTSPAEGLWSIATGWEDQWPADWRHAKIEKIETVNEWTICRGTLSLDEGEWKLRESYRPSGEVIEVIRRFEWHGDSTLERATLSVRWQTPFTDVEPLMPGILYYGNPSGTKSGRVATWSDDTPYAIFEEHRYPMPFASLETATDSDAERLAVTLHSVPCTAPYGNKNDQWWSLGAARKDDCTELVLLSGPCAANGERSVVKAVQRGFMKYPDTYLNIPPGAVIEKRYYLQANKGFAKGSGFRPAVRASIDLFKPFATEGLPTYDEILRAKYRFAKSRWHEDEKSAGFGMYPTDDSPYVMGWCGQAACLGYALIPLADTIDDPKRAELVQRSLDHLTTSPFNENGFLLIYDRNKNEWHGQDPVSQGQAMENFACAIIAAKDNEEYDTSKWRTFLKKACDIHADRILADDWHPVSTNEGFFISPLCKAYQLFGNEKYKRVALKAANHYADRHVSMEEPYWGGTLDASCEDKEGAWAAMQGFLAAYELTQDEKWLERAQHACDVVLTYTCVYDIEMPPGRLRNHRFKTRGWTDVSAQNQHVDIFGVLIAPKIYKLGTLTAREDLQKLAKVMYLSCGQLIDPYGSQGEQIQHTNFAQRGDMSDVYKMRGGYAEHWTVFWITAYFLDAAAQFEEMNVSLQN
ncbi:hypothetical protein STSP2_00183 [Anaerohalosphaera lusitana]|uniref:Glucoamylase hydrolase n=1 Tax=Anaerohalosphaera lusitana TaxID=1936003 RepID=A0A1U9NH28_9BACT|nr:hypothetical protein [Anaerohalosphaera lusitana]AQT67044.1 hypothetical protein STSP2_00183 [Anaerohalosphaera lusitana]